MPGQQLRQHHAERPDLRALIGRFAVQQRVAHLLVDRLHVRIAIDRSSAAPVVLQIVDAPGGKSLRVLVLMAIAPHVTRARLRPRRTYSNCSIPSVSCARAYCREYRAVQARASLPEAWPRWQ